MGLFSRPEEIGPGRGSDPDRARIGELERRVAALEARLAALLSGTGEVEPAASEAWLAEVRELFRSGKKIQAIKLYREHTGVGLKEAKDAVDAMAV